MDYFLKFFLAFSVYKRKFFIKSINSSYHKVKYPYFLLLLFCVNVGAVFN